jgi:WD40 repeat protein
VFKKKMPKFVYEALTLDTKSYVANDDSIDIIDHATQTIVRNFPVGSFVQCIALSRDKSSLLVGCDDGNARVMDIITEKICHVCRGHTKSINCIIAGSGSEIITCSWDMSIKRWTSEGVCVKTYLGHSNAVKSVLFSAKRNRIYSGGNDKSIRAWDYDSGVEVAKMLGHQDGVTSLAWVQGEETFVSGSFDNSIRLWDATGMVFLKLIGSRADYVKSVAASTDGRFVVSGGWDNKVNIWDVETSQLLHSLAHHGHWVNKVTISPTGVFLGSGDEYGMFHIHKIDPPFSMIIHEGIIWTSTHARKNSCLLSDDGIIRDRGALRIVAKITSSSTCTMLSDSTFILATNNNNNNNNRKKATDNDDDKAVAFTAPSPSSAQLWLEAICAMRHHISLGDDDNPQASQIIHRYRFDTFQLIWFHTGPFGLRVPKTVIELIGSYLLGNGGLPVL